MVEPRDTKLTEEMLDLFERGLKLAEEIHHFDEEIDDATYWQLQSGEAYREFIGIYKRLNWTLCDLPLHCEDVFNPQLDGPPPEDMNPNLCRFRDWHLPQAWRRALMAGLEARNARKQEC